MCVPNMTKEICNAWKCDRTIASVVLSSKIHEIIAQLHGWNSSRIAQDDIISKPHSGGTAVQFHQDGKYISDQFSPTENNSITAWIPLDDVNLESGTIEYVRGSHSQSFHSHDHHSNFHSAIDEPPDVNSHRHAYLKTVLGIDMNHPINTNSSLLTTAFDYVEVPKGAIAFHHQSTYHGSGLNTTPSRQRRALVIHAINGEVKFSKTRKASYIYGRYDLDCEEVEEKEQEDKEAEGFTGEEERNHKQYIRAGQGLLHQRFFPICWAKPSSGMCRSSWLRSYCADWPSEDLLYNPTRSVE